MDAGQADAIATAVGAISAAMVILGPLIRSTVEALKATPLVPFGYGGLAAMGIGAGIGVIVGGVALAQGGGLTWLLVALVAGFFAGVGGVVSDHAIAGAAIKAPDLPQASPDVPTGGASGPVEEVGA